MQLQNKVAIITGAASGIGQGIALAMAAEGASVAVDYVGRFGPPTDTLNQIQQAGAKPSAWTPTYPTRHRCST